MTSDRRRAAVLGSPIAHSLSPVLHRAAYAELGLDWAYDVIECDDRSLLPLLNAMAAAGRHAGCSLTMPLKHVALSLVDTVADTAALVGAVNTVVFGNGGRTGHNTDIAGLVDALREAGVLSPPAVPVVLGAGGAARAAIGALAALGAQTVAVCARRLPAAAPLVDVGERCGVAVVVQPWATAHGAIGAADVVVSAAPAGATDEIAAAGWPGATPLVDVVYAPWPTALGTAAAATGAPVVGGLAMLVGQAAEAVTLMTGRPAPAAVMRRAGELALAARA